MKLPKTTEFTLKRIVENLNNIPTNGFGEKPKTLSQEQKTKLHNMAENFEQYGAALQNETAILDSARSLSELCELAETYAINECPDHFERKIIDRDMKECKKRVMEYQKIAQEAYSHMQQLSVGYQDIGHILGRYYSLKKAKSLDEPMTLAGEGFDQPTDM